MTKLIVELSVDFPPKIGGIAGHVHQLSNALSKTGNYVIVITKGVNELPSISYENDHLKIIRIPIINIPHTISFQYFLGAILYIYFLKINNQISILHYHNGGIDSLIAYFVLFTPKIFTNHSSIFVNRYQKADNKNQLLRELKAADFIITPSSQLAEFTISCGYPNDRVKFISNGVNTNIFFPIPLSEKIQLKNKYFNKCNDIIILCPRRLQKKNGVSFFLKSITRLPDEIKETIKIIIAGDYPIDYPDSDVRDVNSTIIEEKLSEIVKLLGFVDYEKMPELFGISDIVVIPSFIEATSLACLEAMACGKVVIASDVGGIPEIITDTVDGVLFEPGNQQDLVEKLQILIKDESYRDLLSKNAIEKVQKSYSWDNIAIQVLNIYNGLLR